MNLAKLLDPLDPIQIRGQKDKEILGIQANSREVRPKDLFIAISSTRAYIDEAILSGAVAIVTDIFNPFLPKEITQIEHPNPREFAGVLANRFYQNPSKHLDLFGVTGTSGKTTTAWMIRHLLGEDCCGILGSLGAFMRHHMVETLLNTPEPVMVCRLLQEMVKEGLKNCSMEVSSHGLDQKRVDHLRFHTAIFLNLSHDHLDYHKTMESYFLAKKRFFDFEVQNKVIHLDDPYGKRLVAEVKGSVVTFGRDADADFRIENEELTLHGSKADLIHQGKRYRLEIASIGSFHISNMVAAIAAVYGKTLDLDSLIERAKTFQAVPGRGEMVVTQKNFQVMVDYSHKPDALKNILQGLRKAGAKKITTVFGCGGERDAEKRPVMARIAEEYSDKVIVTTDNPRKEDPELIIQQIVQGFEMKSHKVVADRKSAIFTALQEAEEGELVLIAGRGNEKEQKLRSASIPFLDSEVAKNLLDRL
ncbi:MAG: UDP-N-acetylmuramoyl-L-alanyl-D-glutamate--2,6-diaminopimelate ligase [Chlamydiia bacterium]